MLGDVDRARAKATLRFSPPDRLEGFRRSNESNFNKSIRSGIFILRKRDGVVL